MTNMTYMMKKHTTTFQFRSNGIKSLLMMLLLFVGGFGEGSSFAIGDDRDPSEEEIGGGLQFFTKRRVIGVTSTLREAADVRIYSTTGNTIAAFTVQPGETIERDIPIAGVYIIRADKGRITKKLALK